MHFKTLELKYFLAKSKIEFVALIRKDVGQGRISAIENTDIFMCFSEILESYLFS